MVMDAAVTNTYVTKGDGQNTGEVEELADIIVRIDSEETPLYAMIKKGKIKSTTPEWLIQELEAADDTNAQPEGFRAVLQQAVQPERMGNTTQILARTGGVSRTMEKQDKAGRASEIAYQKLYKGIAMKRDLEAIFFKNQAQSTSGIRKMATFPSWITNIASNAVTPGVAPSGDGTDTYTAGTTPGALDTIDLFDDVMQACYDDGGKPKVAIVNPRNKRLFSRLPDGSVAEFRANVSGTSAAKLQFVGAVDAYLTDFGMIELVIDRMAPVTRILFLDPRYISYDTLPESNFAVEMLAKLGDSTEFFITAEGTLTNKAPKSCGSIEDLV